MTPEETFSSILINMLKPFWWMFPLLLLLPVLKLFAPMIKGRLGEGLVNLAAKLRLDPMVYHLLKDVTIPAQTGTTQIDHVVVSIYGIFVIETKNYKGWIYASARDSQWTQVIYRHKHRFQNPLRQNYAHICALSDFLCIPNNAFHSVVCFMGDAQFKTPVPEGVFLEGRYVNYIQSFQKELFSKDEVASLVQRLESGRLERGFHTNRRHVQQLNARFSGDIPRTTERDSLVCPDCGAALVLRTARKGANAGNQFWGCSRYPACKHTLKESSH